MRNVIVHIHIFKNAGTTFDDTLKRNFGNDFIDHREDNEILKGKLNYLLEFLKKHSNIKAFSSHSIHFLLKNSEEFNFLPVYFIRHPIDRIRSVYSFEKKQTPITTKGARKAKELTFEEYIHWYMKNDSPATIRNAQMIFLSGMGPGSREYEKMFAEALNQLNRSELIGVVDRYDESMVVFEEHLRAYFPKIDLSYIRRNITDNEIDKSVEEKAEKLLSQLSDDLKKEVIEKNAYDSKLYNMAQMQLDAKIAKIENFDKKLESFKERCLLRLVKSKTYTDTPQKIIDLLRPLLEEKSQFGIQSYLVLGNAYSQIKNYDQALKIYEEAMQKFPQNPWPFFYQAEMYRLKGEKKKAQKLFDKYFKKFKPSEKIISAFNKFAR